MSIRAKLILGFCLVAVIVLISGGTSLYVFLRTLEKAIGHEATTLAQDSADQLARSFEARSRLLNNLVLSDPTILAALSQSNAQFQSMGNAAAIQYMNQADASWSKGLLAPSLIASPASDSLRRIQVLMNRDFGYHAMGEIFITNSYGGNAAQTGMTSDFRQDDEDWWQKAKEKGSFASGVKFDESAGMRATELAIRIDASGGGVLKAVLNLKEMHTEIATLKERLPYPDAIVVLRDSNSELIDHLPADAIVPKSATRKCDAVSITEHNGSNYLFACAQPVAGASGMKPNWKVEIELPTSEAYSPIYKLAAAVTSLVLGGSICGVILILLILRSIGSTFTQFQKSARAIRQGDFSVAVSIQSRDELEEFARTFNEMRVDMDQALQSMQYQARILKESEEKQRLLFEGTTDLIFEMKPNLQITSVNRAVARELAHSAEFFVEKNFFDLISFSDPSAVAPMILMDELAQATITKNNARFRFRFIREGHQNSTGEFDVRLEFLRVEESDTIIARATPIQEDVLVPFLEEESATYHVASDLRFVDHVADRFCQPLHPYLPEDDRIMVGLGIREMIINAIEHGNLGITYQEKTNAMSSDSYISLIASRKEQADLAKRKVHLKYQVTAKGAEYSVEDEGRGFNPAEIAAKGAPGLKETHGRGIVLTRSAFDRVEYNEKGNRVTLSRSFGDKPFRV